MPVNNNNDKIKKLRYELGLSQREFAIKLNMNINTINSYEHSLCNPSVKALLKICKTFNLDDDYFIFNKSDPENKKTIGEKIIDLRISKGLYINELAKLMNIGENTLRYYEGNSIKPSLERLEKLCEIFDLPENNCFSEDMNRYKRLNKLNNDNVGKKIRELRIEKGLYLRDLAQLLNVSNTKLRVIEVGKIKIKENMLMKILEIFNLPLDYFD